MVCFDGTDVMAHLLSSDRDFEQQQELSNLNTFQPSQTHPPRG